MRPRETRGDGPARRMRAEGLIPGVLYGRSAPHAIAVEGNERFRLVELTEGRSFQTAEVEPYEDETDDRDPETAERAFELYRRLAALVPSPPDDPDPGARLLSFEIGARVDFGAEPKQQLLELRSETERLALVCGLLERAAETLERERELRARASQNGKVVPGDN